VAEEGGRQGRRAGRLVRRNIQKNMALDALVLELRPVKRRDLPDIPVCFSPALAGYPALCYPYV